MKHMKRKSRIILFMILLLMSVCLLLYIYIPIVFQIPIIGRVSGPEFEYIEIDGITYIAEGLVDGEKIYSGTDRGKYIGSVTNGDVTMRVFRIKGDESHRYLYALYEWEGDIYIRQE